MLDTQVNRAQNERLVKVSVTVLRKKEAFIDL